MPPDEPTPQPIMEISFSGDPILAPFTGDTFIAERFLELRDVYGIVNAVETGTYLGRTFIWICNHFDNAFSCEVSPKNYQFACHAIFAEPGAPLDELYPEAMIDPPELGRFVLKNQDSVDFIHGITDILEGETIFFLDAHWYSRCPLLEELEAIASCGLRPAVIAIHDSKPITRTSWATIPTMASRSPWIGFAPVWRRSPETTGASSNVPSSAGGAMRGIVYLKRNLEKAPDES